MEFVFGIIVPWKLSVAFPSFVRSFVWSQAQKNFQNTTIIIIIVAVIIVYKQMLERCVQAFWKSEEEEKIARKSEKGRYFFGWYKIKDACYLVFHLLCIFSFSMMLLLLFQFYWKTKEKFNIHGNIPEVLRTLTHAFAQLTCVNAHSYTNTNANSHSHTYVRATSRTYLFRTQTISQSRQASL